MSDKSDNTAYTTTTQVHEDRYSFFYSESSPTLIYGTAWKAENTANLVQQALTAGFRAFDTAAQPKHYREDLLGASIRDAIAGGQMLRHELYIQTKFTTVAGHDLLNMPYDPQASIHDQVTASINSSLKNLGGRDWAEHEKSDTYIDCLILHACLPTVAETLEAWETMSSFVPHPVRCLGISNLSLPMLEALWDGMRLKPRVLQNAFVESRAYDLDLRKFCTAKGVAYQGFAILKKNARLVHSDPVQQCCQTLGISPEAALYGLLQRLDIAILDGSTSRARMEADVKDLNRLHKVSGDEEDEKNVKRWVVQLSELISLG